MTNVNPRYSLVTAEKACGATYTPQPLADFVAEKILEAASFEAYDRPVRILDPAVGDGALLASLLKFLPKDVAVEASGFDTSRCALQYTTARLRSAFPTVALNLRLGDFLSFALETQGDIEQGLFDRSASESFDLIIANPPYVRTQIIGASHAQRLARDFGLTGRVDLYHAFIVAMSMILRPHGVAGIIVSNRFMTTKAGSTVRRAVLERFGLKQVWDLGDTKLFDAAVLPAVLIAEGKNGNAPKDVQFASIYETREKPHRRALSVFEALRNEGVTEIADGRAFRIRAGTLDRSLGPTAVWRVATRELDAWLERVAASTWRRFGDVGKIRVGVKTCADDVFIRDDWARFPDRERPELLRPLTTHHIGRRYRARPGLRLRQIVYPHESVDGERRAVNLDVYPRSRAYLMKHRAALESRSYVREAGRQWYELWVPQDPASWEKPKLVFRDISEKPCFWVDLEGSVVNGDCYWITIENEKLLWLAAAVANSTFIETFYDHRFNNKLYSGRRRFITQYVAEFPLPDWNTQIAADIIERTMVLFRILENTTSNALAAEVDRLVWLAFGLVAEEVAR